MAEAHRKAVEEMAQEGWNRVGRSFGELEPECKRLQRWSVMCGDDGRLVLKRETHTVDEGVRSSSWRRRRRNLLLAW